ncbi:MAG: major capsid protein [Treponema sp.]|nr:major capsid protein [Treponema sp.]
MWDFLRKFFVIEMLVNALNRLPPMRTFIMDLIYPESVRFNHPKDKLAHADLGLPEKNIPLITRGSQSYAVPLNKTTLKLIDPANITPSLKVGSHEANEIRSLGLEQVKQLIDRKIDKLRKIVRKTTEAMAIQSLSGKISYAIRNADNTLDDYIVDFGSIKKVTIAKKWNAAGITPGEIVADIGTITSDMQLTSDGTDIVFLCGSDVYAALVNVAAQNKNSDIIKVMPDHVLIGNAKFIICNAMYWDHRTKANVKAIPAKAIKAIAKDDAFSLAYCALDSFAASHAGLPFFIDTVEEKDPEALKLIAQSRPMPIPNIDAIRDAEVLS